MQSEPNAQRRRAGSHQCSESQPAAIPASSWGALWRMAKRLVRLKLARWLLQFGFAIGALKRVEKDAP